MLESEKGMKECLQLPVSAMPLTLYFNVLSLFFFQIQRVFQHPWTLFTPSTPVGEVSKVRAKITGQKAIRACASHSKEKLQLSSASKCGNARPPIVLPKHSYSNETNLKGYADPYHLVCVEGHFAHTCHPHPCASVWEKNSGNFLSSIGCKSQLETSFGDFLLANDIK